jgi:hypothetical protein
MDGIHGQGNQDQASLRKLVELSNRAARLKVAPPLALCEGWGVDADLRRSMSGRLFFCITRKVAAR